MRSDPPRSDPVANHICAAICYSFIAVRVKHLAALEVAHNCISSNYTYSQPRGYMLAAMSCTSRMNGLKFGLTRRLYMLRVTVEPTILVEHSICKDQSSL